LDKEEKSALWRIRAGARQSEARRRPAQPAMQEFTL
jgi:hypothetical protein